MNKILSLCIIFFSLLDAKANILDIDETIKIALENSPDIVISNLDFKGALQRNKFQEGYYLPTLNLSVTSGKQSIKFKGADTIGSTALIGGLTASWLLYDFGKTSGSVDASHYESIAYKATMYQQIAYKILMTKVNYYEVLKAKSIISVFEKSVVLQQNQLIRAKRYFDSGIRTIIDISDAQVRLTKAQLDLKNANYTLKLRRALLEETMGTMPSNGKYILQYKELSLPNISKTLPTIKTSLAQLEGFAYDNRQELKKFNALMQSQNAQTKSIDGDYYPTIAVKGDYTAQSVTEDIASFTSQNQWKAGVVVEWNLFAGYQTDTSLQEAKINSMKATAQLKQARLVIKREVIDAYLGMKKGKDTIVLSESISKDSSQKYLQAQKRYDNGLSDYIELQEAQQSYITSLSDLVTSYYDYYISIAQLDYAVGR